MDYYITVEGNLTSYVFYNEIIKKLHNYFSEGNTSQIIFDFSRTKLIDPLILPNLLCVGYLIVKQRKRPAKIFIPGTHEFAPIWGFLYRTRFFAFAREYNLFEYDTENLGGLKRVNHDAILNKIEVFSYEETENGDIDIDLTKQRSWEKLNNVFVPFINEFLSMSEDKYVKNHKIQISNSLLSFCREVIENALFHGLSFCFLNMQYSSLFGKQIKISISDCGMGFKNAINEDRSRSIQILSLQETLRYCHKDEDVKKIKDEINKLIKQCYPLSQLEARDDVGRLATYPQINTELEGIVYGLLSRKDKPYGLYNIHKNIIHAMGGTIRIHSNDTQLILSERLWGPLEVCDSPGSLMSIITRGYKQNVRTELKFKGVHIEMDIMLEEPQEGRK